MFNGSKKIFRKEYTENVITISTALIKRARREMQALDSTRIKEYASDPEGNKKLLSLVDELGKFVAVINKLTK